MKVLFNVGEYKNINIIPEVSLSDQMDGTPDNMSFSFIYDEDITKNIKLKDYCYVTIEDNIHNIEEVGTISYSEIYIDDNQYLIIDGLIYDTTDEENSVGVINYINKELDINNKKYLYYNELNSDYGNIEKLYLDNRKYYYMCVSQISSLVNSMSVDNGYTITVSLKEQTMWLKDCIKSDLTITPSLYPKIGDNHMYPTLLEATYKICDRHNMHLLNYKISEIDEDVKSKLSEVACPDLTYKDLSTFDQLYDIFIRIGRIPYFENGKLYGILFTGDKNSSIVDLSKYVSSVQSVKEEEINQNIYYTKVYNNVYDTETLIVPSIFQGINTTEHFFAREVANKTTQEWIDWVQEQYKKWTYLNGEDEIDSKRLLGVSNYDYNANGIEDATNYPLILPSNIQYVTSIRRCEPVIRSGKRTEQDGTTNQTMEFGFKQYAIGYSIYIGNTKISDVKNNKFTIGTVNYKIDNEKIYVGETLVNKIFKVFMIDGTPYRILDDKVYPIRSWDEKASISNNSFVIDNITYYIIYRPAGYYIVSTNPEAINGSIINNVIYDELFGPSIYGNPVVETTYGMRLFYNRVATVNEDGNFYLSGHTYSIIGNSSIQRDDQIVALWQLGINNTTQIVIGGTPIAGQVITGGTPLNIIIIGNQVYSYDDSYLYGINNNSYSINYSRTLEFSSFPDDNGDNAYLLPNTSMPNPSKNWSFIYTNSIISPVQASLDIYDEPNILEYSYWSKLEKLQQNQFAYFNVGENKINQPLAFVADKEDLDGSLPLSDKRLYDLLKASFFIVRYKPILDQSYINYDYSMQHDGQSNMPLDVHSYSLPYKNVSDKQVYPLLEYNLEKGLDYTTMIKIVTNDKSVLDLYASSIVKINGKKYIIGSIDFLINDNSIEASIKLSREVIINSILSSYRDNIRVSSNLSTEETVTSIFTILSEEVVSLYSEPDSNYLDNIGDDNSYFTQELGVALAKGGYNDLNMNVGFSDPDIYRLMTKYPLRFGKINNKEADEDSNNYSFAIKVKSDVPYQDGVFTFNSFPIYAREIHYSTWPYGRNIKRKITISSYKELQNYNNTTFYVSVLANKWPIVNKWGDPYWYAYWEFSSDNQNWTPVRPERWEGENLGYEKGTSRYYSANEGWSRLNGLSFKYKSLEKSSPKGVLSIIESYNGDDSSLDTRQFYCTEGFFTQSGLICSYQYLINDPVSLLTRYIPSNQLDYNVYVSSALNNLGKTIEIDDAFINSNPIFFNTSNNGCVLLGFGEKDTANYNVSIFNTLSNNYGFKLDMREIPSVYLQYKTIMRDNGYAKLKWLSKDVKWMSQSEWGISSLKPKLIRFKNHINIDNLDLNSENLNNFIVDDDVSQSVNGYILSKSFTEDENSEYDYGIIMVSDDYSYIKKIIQFNINGIQDFNKVFISIKIKNSYDTIKHIT